MAEVEIDLPIAYQNGRILLSTMKMQKCLKNLLKPYQTLAIYVN